MIALQREGLSEPMAILMHLKIADDENLLALHWGYGFDASVKGKVALAQTVEFSAGSEGFAALGVYRKSEKLVNALQREGLSDPMANLIHLKIADEENLLVLHWG